MGNYMRAARELPKLRNQLQEITAKRIEAERQLKLLKNDLDKKAEALEQQRVSAIAGSEQAFEQLQKQMDAELKAVREEGEKPPSLNRPSTLGRMTLANPNDDDNDASAAGSSRRLRRIAKKF